MITAGTFPSLTKINITEDEVLAFGFQQSDTAGSRVTLIRSAEDVIGQTLDGIVWLRRPTAEDQQIITPHLRSRSNQLFLS